MLKGTTKTHIIQINIKDKHFIKYFEENEWRKRIEIIGKATLFWLGETLRSETKEEKGSKATPLSSAKPHSALLEIHTWLARYEKNYEDWKTPTVLGMTTRKKDLPFLCKQAAGTLKTLNEKSGSLPGNLQKDFSKLLIKWRTRSKISETPLLFDNSPAHLFSRRRSTGTGAENHEPPTRLGLIRSESR